MADERLFYSAEIIGNTAWLDEDETHHCMRVLRYRTGDTVQVVNGKGSLFEGELGKSEAGRVPVILQKTVIQLEQPAIRLHIAVAPVKSADRLGWLVEKATETGVGELTFLETQHSERFRLNAEKLQKKAIQAMKQSKNLFLPVINEVEKFSNIIKLNNYDLKYIAHCQDNKSKEKGISVSEKCDSILILIGPEGDFSSQEADAAIEQGFAGLDMGPMRLRTETAVIWAASAVQNELLKRSN